MLKGQFSGLGNLDSGCQGLSCSFLALLEGVGRKKRHVKTLTTAEGAARFCSGGQKTECKTYHAAMTANGYYFIVLHCSHGANEALIIPIISVLRGDSSTSS